jgi:endonuclease/exonuclease/phosphatase family metal-dependent hydrolase
MGVSLKLVSLNIERSKHLDLIVPFLGQQAPEVACLQEVMEDDIDRISRAMGGAACIFEPMAYRPDESSSPMGIAIFSHLEIVDKNAHYYSGIQGVVRDSIQSDPSTYNLLNRLVLTSVMRKDGITFRISTTHFTWTPGGIPDDVQRHDMKALLGILESLGGSVLTGDFNAPRGGEIFAMLTAKYKDNVPAHYTTSIDGSLHKAGPLELMVDGFFSTPVYKVSDIEMVSGVSDHCALVATVSKTD